MSTRVATVLLLALLVAQPAPSQRLLGPDERYPTIPPPPLPPEYQVLDLGTLGGNESAATALNERREVVGYSQTRKGQSHAFLWRSGKMINLGTLGGPNSKASDINNSSVVIGQSDTLAKFETAFLWRAGRMSRLSRKPWTFVAKAINDQGVIVGTANELGFLYEKGTFSRVQAPPRERTTRSGRRRKLLGKNYFTEINTINNRGDLGGAAEFSPKSDLYANPLACIKLHRERSRSPDAGRPSSPVFWGDSSILGINARGDFVGMRKSLEMWEVLAVFNGQPHYLNAFSVPGGINNKGQIAGTAGDDTAVVHPSITRAVVWTKAGRHDLTRRISPKSGWLLKEAADINDRGEIVGWGEHNGKKRAFLLLPFGNSTIH